MAAVTLGWDPMTLKVRIFPNGAKPSSLFYFNMFVLTTHPHKVHEYPDYDILASAAVPLFFYVSCGCAIANLLTASKLRARIYNLL